MPIHYRWIYHPKPPPPTFVGPYQPMMDEEWIVLCTYPYYRCLNTSYVRWCKNDEIATYTTTYSWNLCTSTSLRTDQLTIQCHVTNWRRVSWWGSPLRLIYSKSTRRYFVIISAQPTWWEGRITTSIGSNGSLQLQWGFERRRDVYVFCHRGGGMFFHTVINAYDSASRDK